MNVIVQTAVLVIVRVADCPRCNKKRGVYNYKPPVFYISCKQLEFSINNLLSYFTPSYVCLYYYAHILFRKSKIVALKKEHLNLLQLRETWKAQENLVPRI